MFSVGDVVVCVDARPCTYSALSATAHLAVGKLYRVTGAVLCQGGFGILVNDERPHLVPGFSTPGAWDPDRFRKVLKADEQFTAQIRACRPAHRKTPVPA